MTVPFPSNNDNAAERRKREGKPKGVENKSNSGKVARFLRNRRKILLRPDFAMIASLFLGLCLGHVRRRVQDPERQAPLGVPLGRPGADRRARVRKAKDAHTIARPGEIYLL